MRRISAALLVAVAALLLVASTASATAPVFSGTFDGSGTPAGSMTPVRLAVNETTGDVWVIDGANDVVNRFDADGRYQSQLLGTDTTARTFEFGGSDDDIAVDNSGGATQGNVYVVGERGGGPGKISAFDSTGRFLWQVDGAVDACGVDVDDTGRLFTADYTDGIQQRDVSTGALTGSPLVVTGDTCHFSIDGAGDFILARWGVNEVNRYDSTGRFERTLFSLAPANDTAVDSSNGDVYALIGFQMHQWDANDSQIPDMPFELPGPTAAIPGIDINGANHKIYVVEQNTREVMVYDAIVRSTLDVTVDGASSGSVTADAGAIADCTSSGGACSDVYDNGTTVTLTATPESGASVRWAGCDSAVGNECTVTLNADTSVTATFDPTPPPTCETDPSLCPPARTCATDPSLCPPPPARTCATDASLCPPPPARTCATDASLCPPPPANNLFGQCVARANKAFNRARKAAKKKSGKARAKAMKKAQKKKNKAVADCRK